MGATLAEGFGESIDPDPPLLLPQPSGRIQGGECPGAAQQVPGWAWPRAWAICGVALLAAKGQMLGNSAEEKWRLTEPPWLSALVFAKSR